MDNDEVHLIYLGGTSLICLVAITVSDEANIGGFLGYVFIFFLVSTVVACAYELGKKDGDTNEKL